MCHHNLWIINLVWELLCFYDFHVYGVFHLSLGLQLFHLSLGLQLSLWIVNLVWEFFMCLGIVILDWDLHLSG